MNSILQHTEFSSPLPLTAVIIKERTVKQLSDLDAVCKLLQGFGSDGLHGGDEGRELVLSAGSCALNRHMNLELERNSGGGADKT